MNVSSTHKTTVKVKHTITRNGYVEFVRVMRVTLKGGPLKGATMQKGGTRCQMKGRTMNQWLEIRGIDDARCVCSGADGGK